MENNEEIKFELKKIVKKAIKVQKKKIGYIGQNIINLAQIRIKSIPEKQIENYYNVMKAVSEGKYVKKDVDALYSDLEEEIIKDVEARNEENKAKRGEIIQNSTELLKDIKSSTYISNDYGQRTTVIYDVHNKRIVEKLILYALEKDETKFIVTDRIIYSYSQNGDLEKIIEIEKGEDDRLGKYNDDNEYLSVRYKITREDSFVNDIDFYYQYDFEKNKRKKLYTLRLEEDIDFDKKKNLTIHRVKNKIKDGKFYEYIYDKQDPKVLVKIVEYKILLDLTFLKNIVIAFFDTGNSNSNFFIKNKISEKTKELPNQLFKGNKINHQNIITEKKCLIHSSIEEEDFLRIEQKKLNKLIKKLNLDK